MNEKEKENTTYKVWIHVEQELEDGTYKDVPLPFCSCYNTTSEDEAIQFAEELNEQSLGVRENMVIPTKSCEMSLTVFEDRGNYGIEENGAILYDPVFTKETADMMVDMLNSEKPPKNWEEIRETLVNKGTGFNIATDENVESVRGSPLFSRQEIRDLDRALEYGIECVERVSEEEEEKRRCEAWVALRKKLLEIEE